MLQSYHQSAEQYHDIKIANSSFENVAQLKYLGISEIKSRLNLANSCYNSAQKLLSSHLLFRNINIRI
jgi:hypothetical protein